MKKLIWQYILILMVVPIVGLFLLWGVHLLPTYPMRVHVYASKDLLEKEFVDETVVDGFSATLTGNFTDSLMLEHAVYDGGHSTWQQALNMYRAESFYDKNDPDGWQPGQSLLDYLEGVPQAREVEYARYWHGYLILLKPLLMFTSVAALRLLNSSMQILLIGFCVMYLERRRQSGVARAFLCSIPFLYFISTYASISQSVCMYLMLVAVIWQLRYDDFLERKRLYGFYFLLVGMATSYFDFLTYPLVTVGYPLGIYLCLHENTSIGNLKKMLQYTCNWAIGYFWMWCAKWILAAIFTGNNIVADAFGTLSVRIGSAGQMGRGAGFIAVVRVNLEAYGNRGFLPIVILLAVAIVWRVIRCQSKVNALQQLVPFIVLSLYPFAWWFVTQNHSEEHWMFTCRIFAIFVFAIAAGIQKCYKRA